MPELDEEDRPYHAPRGYMRSTGPTSPEGKAVSSQNATKHGCCSNKLILPDEDEQEWKDLKQGWLDTYQPQTHAGLTLVCEVAVAQWLLLRARRRYNEAEQRVYAEQGDPLEWTAEQQKTIERFTRYRTTQERAFNRALSNVEGLRRSRSLEAARLRMAEHRAERLEQRRQTAESTGARAARDRAPAEKGTDLPKTRAEATFQGQNAPKKQRKVAVLEQWAQVTVEDGKTTTKLFPSNEKLIEEGKTMEPPPELVYRRLEFVGGVPPEYHWSCQSRPERFERGGAGIQRMTTDTWLEVIEREAAAGTGHIGPTGVGNLPRPKERGGCDCEVCAHNREVLEGREE
jgi:hypothetical protein